MTRSRLLVFCLFLSLSVTAQDSLSFGGIDLPGAEVRASYLQVSPLAQAFTIEEVRRLPATFYDPARLIALLPGVVQTNDQANHLSVRGNTPNANLWRLNGLAVVNPNHTANAGTFYDLPTLNGGGTNALSAQVLDNSAFLAGGLPARYGNATGGTFDLRLRPGNHDKRVHQLQASLIGFDAATEGPIANSGISYLVNARYSFTGLLADLGVDFGGEEISFSDINAHLHGRTERSAYSLFTVLGRSTNYFSPDPDEEVTEQKELFDIDFENDLAIVGANFKTDFTSGTLTAGAAFSTLNTERIQDFFDPNLRVQVYDGTLDQQRISAFVDHEVILSQQVTLQAGAELLEDRFDTATNFYNSGTGRNIERSVEARSVAPYVGTRILSKSGGGALELAARAAWYQIGNNRNLIVFEPRLRYRLRWNDQRVVVALERLSRMPYAGLLLGSEAFFDFIPVNNQASVAYGRKLGKVNTLLTAYYQYTPGEYAARVGDFLLSANNFLEIDPNFVFTTRTATRRYGLEAEVAGGQREKGWYYRGSASLFRAETEQSDESWAKDRYSSDLVAKLTLGREWPGTDNNANARTYGFNVALIGYGGERTGRIVGNSGRLNPYFIPPDYGEGFVNTNGVYFRPDLRVYRTKERGQRSTTIALDIQNVAGVSNTAASYFDTFLNRPNEREALPLIPVLSYRVVWR
ncbi:TonB-dependent receptor-like protein [Neolewinella xylanilytica]|uniref:TonB-dependent receptor-like protein n=1 Tax=Neolewinella xylanilytica TaxID=1514080 RepID=A0A2S6I751_9BACT|nr:TonB-dependent receptor plug domain-containing protein [Neolewinella xylanilytica]PPK87325.1 TonB-dependent receptor-like protein [Neolewinella xylanilytica]